MSNLGKILVAVVVLIVLVGGFRYLKNKGTDSAYTTGTNDSTVTTTDSTSTATPPEATANIDDAVTAFSQEQTQEASLTDTSAADKALVTSDSQIINDTTKTYDETQF